MNFLDNITSKIINGSSTSKLDRGYFPYFGFGGGSKTAAPVTVKTALTLSAVWNAAETVSNAIAIVPFGVFKKLADGGRERDVAHPVDWLLTEEPDGPNGILTPFQFRKLVGLSLVFRGNCLFKVKTGNNGARYLDYIAWDDVEDIKQVEDSAGAKHLIYYIKGGKKLLANEVLHYRGLSLDGICGLSVVKYGMISMGVAIETQDFSYVMAQNKGYRQAVIETDKVIGGPMGAVPTRPVQNPVPAGAENPVNTLTGKQAIVAGVRSALQEKDIDRVLVLDEGMKYKPITITAQEAQLIEQGKFSIEDIARWFNVPLHMLKSLQQSTNNNIEQQSLDFAYITIQPWITNIEQEEKKKLLTPKERAAGYFIRGNMDVLLRSDSKSRAAVNTAYVNSGILTVNEVREKEDRNPMEGGAVLRFPVNTQSQEQIDKSLKDE